MSETSSSPIGEDELHAYVDGALLPKREAELAAWLAANPVAQERVRQWQAQNEGFHRLFDPVLDEELPERLRPAAIRRRGGRMLPHLARAAAALLLLAVGTGLGWWLHGQAAPQGQRALAEEAMTAHLVYVPEVRHPVEVAAAEHAHLVGWLSKRLGAPLSTPDLRAAGFELVGGRLLPANVSGGAEPAAQFMYEDRSGQRVTVYVRRAGATTPTAFRYASAGGANAFYWTDAGLAYAIVGGIGRERLTRLADEVYRQLGGVPG